MNTIRLGAMSVLLALVLACTSQETEVYLTGLELLRDAQAADITIQSGEVIDTIEAIPLNSVDRMQVIRAFDVYSIVRANLTEFIDRPLNMIGARREIALQHDLLRDAYITISRVVAENWESYPTATQYVLASWQQQAFLLERRYQALDGAWSVAYKKGAAGTVTVELFTAVAQIALTVI